jgi:hypothetical protein
VHSIANTSPASELFHWPARTTLGALSRGIHDHAVANRPHNITTDKDQFPDSARRLQKSAFWTPGY